MTRPRRLLARASMDRRDIDQMSVEHQSKDEVREPGKDGDHGQNIMQHCVQQIYGPNVSQKPNLAPEPSEAIITAVFNLGGISSEGGGGIGRGSLLLLQITLSLGV
jgi:hypothetical protein